MNVAVIGLGAMGHGMAARIQGAGHRLAIYNRTASRAQELVSQGAHLAGTPGQAAADAEVLIIMVSDDAALRDVADGPEGFLTALRPGCIVLQMSTVGRETTQWLWQHVSQQRAAMLDAPVLGSRAEADGGKLWVLAGGASEQIERARPVLDCISQQVYHVGDIGRGTELKLCFNMVTGGVIAALAEGIALLEGLGFDPHQYIRILRDTDLPGRLWPGKATLMAERDFAPRFSLDNLVKDMGLALEIAAAANLSLPQSQAARAALKHAATVAGGDKDVAAALEGVLPHS